MTSGVIPGTARASSAPALGTGEVAGGMPVSAAAVFAARAVTIARPRPPPATARTPRPRAQAGHRRRVVPGPSRPLVRASGGGGAAPRGVVTATYPTAPRAAHEASAGVIDAAGPRSDASAPLPVSTTIAPPADVVDRRP